MKIPETRNAAAELILQYKVNEHKGGAEPQRQGAGGILAEEKVSLSSTALDFVKAERAFEALPDVREEKVQALKEQIQAGTYEVDGERIAEKMIGESLVDILV